MNLHTNEKRKAEARLPRILVTGASGPVARDLLSRRMSRAPQLPGDGSFTARYLRDHPRANFVYIPRPEKTPIST